MADELIALNYAVDYDSSQVYISGTGWTNPAYRNITIKKDTSVSPAFYNWFMANATKIPKLSSVLNDNSWADIATAADLGIGQNYWSVGDTKEVILNGSVGYGSSQATFNNQKYWVYIIGFDHNSAKEGRGIAFQGFKTAQSGGIDVAVVETNYRSTNAGMIVNTTNTNSGGWNGSWAYSTCMGQWKACFSSELQSVIRTTTLYTDNTGNTSLSASAVTPNENQVYYLAEYEVLGTTYAANTNEATQQARYAYYAAGNSRTKYRSDSIDTVALWWLRSPYRSGSKSFCLISNDTQQAGNFDANYSLGSAPCFKV